MGDEHKLKHTELVGSEGNVLFEEAYMLTPEEIEELRAAQAFEERPTST
jgi:hypothetical protein